MPAHRAKWLDAAIDAAGTAQLGEFRRTFWHSPRYVILSVFLALAGVAATAGTAWAVASGTAPGWVWVLLIGFAGGTIGCFFGIRSTARDARERVYLFDNGFVHTEMNGKNRTFAWRDITRVERTKVVNTYTRAPIRRRCHLYSVSGQGFYADELWPMALVIAIEAAIAEGKLVNCQPGSTKKAQ
jgi:hypothetical protein